MLIRAFLILTVFAFFSFTQGSTDGVQFYEGSYDNMLREARKEKSPIILDFWASWCGPCQKMDRETFSDPKLGQYINNNFKVYKVNIDSFDGMLITDKYGVESFPSMLVLDSRGNQIASLKGFYPPSYLEKELRKIINRNGLPTQFSQDIIAFN